MIVELFESLVCCIEEIKDLMEFSRESRADAESFFHTLSHFHFIATLMTTKEILGYTKGLTIKLQGRYSGTSVIRHLDNPEHLYNPTQNFGLNGGLH